MGVLRRTYVWIDSRLEIDRELSIAGKAFPAEDSFLLGEVALFCFLMLVLTGVFLGFFFQPSTADVEYDGSVDEYQEEEHPEAYVSVLNITYDVPFGMFIRRLHHWAAHLFVASIALHMLRVFFTGSYQNPREPNWMIGTGLAVLSMGAAYTGYALPYDEFATTATGIGYSIAQSVPIFGDTISYIVFGGDFPSSATIPRFYFLHVFAIPLAIAGLIAAHMAILVRQKHTEAPREGDVDAGERRIARDDDSYVVGLPAFPNQAAISAVMFFLTLGVLSLLAGFLPVHNVAEYGPSDPAATPELIMPDWFLMWVFGFLKIIPSWVGFTIPGTGIHVSTEFIGGAVLPGVVIFAIFVWPLLDSRDDPIHFTVDPLTRPWQTAVGVAGVVLVMIASIAGMNTLLAALTGLSTDVLNPILLGATILGPIVAGAITYVVIDRGDASDRSRGTVASGGDRRRGDRDRADAGARDGLGVGDGDETPATEIDDSDATTTDRLEDDVPRGENDG